MTWFAKEWSNVTQYLEFLFYSFITPFIHLTLHPSIHLPNHPSIQPCITHHYERTQIPLSQFFPSIPVVIWIRRSTEPVEHESLILLQILVSLAQTSTGVRLKSSPNRRFYAGIGSFHDLFMASILCLKKKRSKNLLAIFLLVVWTCSCFITCRLHSDGVFFWGWITSILGGKLFQLFFLAIVFWGIYSSCMSYAGACSCMVHFYAMLNNNNS